LAGKVVTGEVASDESMAQTRALDVQVGEPSKPIHIGKSAAKKHRKAIAKEAEGTSGPTEGSNIEAQDEEGVGEKSEGVGEKLEGVNMQGILIVESTDVPCMELLSDFEQMEIGGPAWNRFEERTGCSPFDVAVDLWGR